MLKIKIQYSQYEVDCYKVADLDGSLLAANCTVDADMHPHACTLCAPSNEERSLPLSVMIN